MVRDTNKEAIEMYFCLFSWFLILSRYYGCFLHIDIPSDGKIWIQHDGTDLNVAEQLLEAGVAKEEIVLGFQPPAVRGVLGFGNLRLGNRLS